MEGSPGRCSSTGVICSIRRFGITIPAMRFRAKTTGALLVCGLVFSAVSLNSWARRMTIQMRLSQDIVKRCIVKKKNSVRAPLVLSPDDGLSVITAALDAHVKAARQRDCSHLVHAIYLRAGFSYPYAKSSDLYDGADDFQRVTRPQPGDLVVWPGHVGIVVNPAERSFFSRLRSGPGSTLRRARTGNSAEKPGFSATSKVSQPAWPQCAQFASDASKMAMIVPKWFSPRPCRRSLRSLRLKAFAFLHMPL